MVIGVLAGTPVDTQMGVDYIIQQGHTAIGRRCSDSPREQTSMQILHKEELCDISIALCKDMILKGARGIFINCNSLSGAIDLKRLRANLSVKVVTPLDIYADCAKSYSSLCVLAANCQSLSAIEHIIADNNSNCLVYGAGLLPLVNAIENLEPRDDIYNNLKINSMVASFKAMGCEALILGCTHFPYILPQLNKDAKIPIINPSDMMLEKLLEN